MSIFFSFVAFLTVCITNAIEYTDVIEIDGGKIVGTIDADVRQFRSIRYATPPINNLRWADPQMVEPWDGVYNATFNPPGCPQRCDLAPHGCPLVQTEDCLYLNVFTPLNANENSKLPVLVWYHGGNFKLGYSGGILYNGTYTVMNQNVIVVTVNYRLGSLGFLWSAVGPHGNYGMLDQILSLEWVQYNIEYFGGDRDKVTIFGQSAGAMAVGLHMIHQKNNSQKLFHGAIMESNPFALPMRDVKTWTVTPELFYDSIGCNQSRYTNDNEAFWDCIRSVPWQQIMHAQNEVELKLAADTPDYWNIFMPWTPTMGTDLFPKQSFWMFQDGDYDDVPFIIGTTTNESVPFVWGAFPSPIGVAEMDIVCGVLITFEDCVLIREQYPYPDNKTDLRPWAAVITTDFLFRCASHNISVKHNELYRNGIMENELYFYHFDYISSFNVPFWGPNQTFCDDVVCHGAELPYVFHPNPSVDNFTYLESEQFLSAHMQQYWAEFATHFKPGNGSNQVPANSSGTAWLPFDLQNSRGEDLQPDLIFDVGQLQLVNNYDTQVCKFWEDVIGYPWIR